MSELKAPREVDMVPEDLRYTPQVKSDIIIQRRQVSMAPVEGMSVYQRDGTNTISFNVQGHKTTNQLLDAKSCYFTWQCKFRDGYPVEDVSNLIEEIIISSNGRVLERIRHAQYIQWYLRQYEMSRASKRRLGDREGFSKYEDCTLRKLYKPDDGRAAVTGHFPLPIGSVNDGGNPPLPAAIVPIVVGDAIPGVAAADLIHAGAGLIGDHGIQREGDTKATANGWRDDGDNSPHVDRFSDSLGYGYHQVNRQFTDAEAHTGRQEVGWPRQDAGGDDQPGTDKFGYRLMKFRLKCSGLLSCEKMLPIGWMPLTIQLRLSDKMRCTDKGSATFDYAIRRPRMHFSVCTVGQAYAAAMQQRLRGPGITINAKLYDTHFKILSSDEQLVIPCNKQRLSKVYLMLHDESATNQPDMNAFRSSVAGAYITKANLTDSGGVHHGAVCLTSYQFQVGTEVSEPVTLEDTGRALQHVGIRAGGVGGENCSTGMPFLEAYLKSIGAVNGHEQDVEYWGRQLDYNCNPWEGGDLLQTFLQKYFVAVYDGEKFLGSAVESGVDTEAGKDIICDLRFGSDGPVAAVRAMALISYHAQFTIKENSVDLSY
jgi:hypothetical protein